jgi:hypothetical protein
MNKPPLTKTRIIAALGIAVAADLIQLPLTAIEATAIFAVPGEVADFILDVFVMAATTFLLGFHVALLPTVIVELVPGVDALPTWTACVGFVIWSRRRKEKAPAPSQPFIDVEEIKPLELMPPEDDKKSYPK